MAMLQCEVCGGKLTGKPGGIFECEYCGMQYDTSWAKAKIQEIKGTVQVEGTVEVTGTVKVEGSANIESLLKRGNNALEDGSFSEAKTHFDKVLDIDAECAEAYLGIALAIKNEKNIKDLIYNEKTDSSYYERAKKYADDSLREKLNSLEKEKAEYKESQKKKINEHRNRIINAQNMISASDRISVGLKSDGTVILAGDYRKSYCKASSWRDIVAVSAAEHHIVGLKSDGTVVATFYEKDELYDYGQCKIRGWKDIVAIAAGDRFTVGLKSDGTVVVTAFDDKHKTYESGFYADLIKKWKNITSIAAGNEHIVGLKSDGTVVVSRYADNMYGGTTKTAVNEWTDIIAISAGYSTVGLKSDGTVVETGHGNSKVENWSDIIAISAQGNNVMGLRVDGTVVSVKSSEDIAGSSYSGQYDIESWTDIVALSTSKEHTLGLKSDGTVISTEYIFMEDEDEEDDDYRSYYYGQCDVEKWKLFDDLSNIEEERKIKTEKNKQLDEKKRIEKEKQRAEEKLIAEEKRLEEEKLRIEQQKAYFCQQGLCRHCGAPFKGLFKKVCIYCGKEKDY